MKGSRLADVVVRSRSSLRTVYFLCEGKKEGHQLTLGKPARGLGGKEKVWNNCVGDGKGEWTEEMNCQAALRAGLRWVIWKWHQANMVTHLLQPRPGQVQGKWRAGFDQGRRSSSTEGKMSKGADDAWSCTMENKLNQAGKGERTRGRQRCLLFCFSSGFVRCCR